MMMQLSVHESLAIGALRAFKSTETAYGAELRVKDSSPVISLMYRDADDTGAKGDSADITTDEHLRIIAATVDEWDSRSAQGHYNSFEIAQVALARINGREFSPLLDKDTFVFEPTSSFVVPDYIVPTQVQNDEGIHTGRTLLEVLSLFSSLDGDDNGIYWRWSESKWDMNLGRSIPQPGHFVINALCSDFFAWGIADAEPITSDKLPELRDAFGVASTVLDGKPLDEICSWATRLYAASSRSMRPQGAYFEIIPDELKDAFLSVGPKRELSPVNPMDINQ